MRLHWCALDDSGGALGLKNRLINKRGHLVQTAAVLYNPFYFNLFPGFDSVKDRNLAPAVGTRRCP